MKKSKYIARKLLQPNKIVDTIILGNYLNGISHHHFDVQKSNVSLKTSKTRMVPGFSRNQDYKSVVLYLVLSKITIINKL